MDDSDLEQFDAFVEKHWKKTFGADNKVLTEVKPKRRGRKPKMEQ